MKKLLLILLVSVMTAGALVGIDTPAAAAADSEAQITIGRQEDVLVLDPVMMQYTNDIWTSTLMLEGLVKTNDEGNGLVPSLAESWEISPDGLTYTFKLVKGVKFSDGSAVTGQDWVWSIERARDTKDSDWKGTAANIKSVEAPDDATLVLRLNENNSSTLPNLSMFSLAVQSKAHYEATKGYTAPGSYPLGTGAYRVKEWVTDSHCLLEKNPNYRNAASVKTQEIKFLTVPDDNSRVMMLQAGEIDIAYPLPFASMKTISNNKALATVGIPASTNRYLVLNHTTNKAFANKAVREALVMGTNKQEIVNMVLFGYGEPAVSFMPRGGLYWNGDITPVPYDAKAAKQKIIDAGYPKGFKVKFLVRSGNAVFEQIATIIKQQWQKIGVDVELVTMETASLLELQYAMKHEVVIGSWSDDVADPTQLVDYWINFEVSKGYFTGWKSDRAYEAFKQANATNDDAERGKLYREIQKIWYDDAVSINLYHQQFCWGMSKKISGFIQTPLGAYRFEGMTKTK